MKMKNKKMFVIIFVVIIVIIGLFLYGNKPKMKTVNENAIWDYKVIKDKNNSKELEGVLSQKNETDKIEVISFYIKDSENNKKVVIYTNEDVEGGFSEENYKNDVNPIYTEFPLGNRLDIGREYSLMLTYEMNDEVKTDEIRFK